MKAFYLFLKKTVAQIARGTGFIIRQRKLKAIDFLNVMTFGQVGMKFPSLEGITTAIGSVMSRVALHKRFNASAVSFLSSCLFVILGSKVQDFVPLKTDFMNFFQRIILFDSSSWGIHKELRFLFPGPGGNGSAAHCKLQLGYDYKNGEFIAFDITGGTRSDNNYTHQLPEYIKPGDLLLTDLGYFCLNTFKNIALKGAYFVSRLLVGTSIFDADTKKKINLLKELKNASGALTELSVILGAAKNKQVACRLICLKVPPAIAQKRRTKIKKDSKRKRRTPSKLNLELASWTLMITNVKADVLPANFMQVIYALRWQIELIFKQFKSVLAMHKSNTKNQYRLQCEIYGRLIAAVFIFKVHAELNSLLWNNMQRELSFDKFSKRIQERAFQMFKMCRVSEKVLILYLNGEIPELIKNCLKGLQKKRKTTLEKIKISYGQQLVISESGA